ncbi:MAG: hypothetical protein JXO22_08550 [Phycisphaerae bacterium]|nr:hypothetical protein [Phycisphaerae bacterium]
MMNETDAQLEHLISRYLDGEATRAERREMRSRLDRDPAAQVLFDETSSLDRELGHALRGALGRSKILRPHGSRWQRIAQTLGLAAAACLVAMLWLMPTKPVTNGRSASAVPRIENLSWRDIAPDRPAEADRALLERPYAGQRHTNRDWIVIPGSRPNECFVIEVNRVTTRVIAVQRDY